jgi:PAS domain S-box-containing protein
VAPSHARTTAAADHGLEALQRDIARLGALADGWKGLDPTSIAESALETLLEMLNLDFVGLRFSDTTHVFLRLGRALAAVASPEDVRAALEQPTDRGTGLANELVIAGLKMVLVRCPLGTGASLGEIIAGASRADFPDPIELAKLKIAVAQTSLACREVRELSDRRPPHDPREKPVSAEALAENEWRLHLTINTIPAMAWSTTPDGLLDFCNQNFVDYVGWTAEEIGGQGFWPIFHPDDVEHLLAAWQEIMATKRPRPVECRMRRADGEYRWFVLRQNPLLDDDGNVIKWYGVGTDIEDRKRAEAALEAAQAALLASEQNLNLIINSLPVLVWSARPDGSADFINQSWRDYAGETADKILEWDFLDLYHPDDIPGMLETWAHDLAHSDQTAMKGRIRGADGRYRWYYFAGRKITDANGVVRWFGCNVDIDDLQRAEDALRANEAALRESERALNLMLDAIPCMAWSATAEGQVDTVNKQFGDFVGATAEDVLRAGFHAQFHPDDIERMFSEWKALMASKTGGDIEGRSLRADGEYRWLLCRCSPLLNAEGEVVRWYGVNMDIEDLRRAEDALRASEAAFRQSERALSLTISTIPAMVWSAKADGILDSWNQPFLDFAGVSFDQIQGDGFYTLFHPDDVEHLRSVWIEVLDSKRPKETEGRMRGHDGEYRWFTFRQSPLLDSDGDVLKWYGIVLDIEDRKRAEEALRASEAALRQNERRLAQTINAVPGLVWSAEADGTVTFLSQQFLDYIGMDAEQARAGGWREAIHPDDAELFFATWEDLLAKPRHNEHEARFRRFDGSYRWMLFRASPSFDETGRAKEWFGVNIDIDDRRRAQDALGASESALRQSERRAQQILSCIPGYTWSSDGGGATTFWSQQYLEYAGAQLEDVLGLGFTKYIHPDDRDATLEQWSAMIAAGEPGESELRLRRADGVYRWFLIRASPFFDDDGRLSQWFGVNVDIENRKRAVEDLRQSQNQLAHITRMTTMGELAVSIAHEVNQPLMAIVTNAGACLRWLSGPKPDLTMARQAAERIVRDGHRAGDIITSLRNLARKSAPRLENINLNQVVQVVLDLLQGELQRRRVIVKVNLQSDAVLIMGDVTQLQQVVLNLVMNAIEAMAEVPEGARRLTVRTGACPAEAIVSVIDTGPGLGAQDPDRLFEAFYSTKAEGVGMGLSICRSIIEAHGGKIWALNHDARGSVFSFTLPLAERQRVDGSYN